MYVFLGLNGFRIDAPEGEVVTTILALASANLDEAALGCLAPRAPCASLRLTP